MYKDNKKNIFYYILLFMIYPESLRYFNISVLFICCTYLLRLNSESHLHILFSSFQS